MNKEGAATAERALKAHSVQSDFEYLAELDEGDRLMQRIVESVDLTEAPEDAVCSLLIDLMHFCEREKIEWDHDVVLRARERFASERRESRGQ